jgi:hypothetical protein
MSEIEKHILERVPLDEKTIAILKDLQARFQIVRKALAKQ